MKLDPLSALAFGDLGRVPVDAVPFWSTPIAIVSSTSETTLRAAPGAGKRITIMRLIVDNVNPAEDSNIRVHGAGGDPQGYVFASTAHDNLGHADKHFRTPIHIAENTAAVVSAHASLGDSAVMAFGYEGSINGPFLDPVAARERLLYGVDGIPEDAEPFSAVNGTLITSTTQQEIAAVRTDGKRYFITECELFNRTPAELPIVTVRQKGASTDTLFGFGVGTGLNNNGALPREFYPPVVTAANAGIEGLSDASTGDTEVVLRGFIG